MQHRRLLETAGAKAGAESRVINMVRKSWSPSYQKALEPRGNEGEMGPVCRAGWQSSRQPCDERRSA